MGDEPTRPRPVEIAYWLWLASAALLVLFGLLALTTSGSALRETLAERGADPAGVDALVLLLRGSGVVSLVVGLAVGLMSGPTRAGDPRFRRAVVALSVVYALIQCALLLTGLGQAPMLLVSIVLSAASVLVYLRSATGWFVRE
ncbi:hypothetical protein [Rhodococcus sp. NPDC127528]|uniref:hypothetical protein n=1 Tax=unclassified Rhodococcus (in: high G+C Gram-positive bacteria) TaxID=192944 RepID=UPI00363E45DA